MNSTTPNVICIVLNKRYFAFAFPIDFAMVMSTQAAESHFFSGPLADRLAHSQAYSSPMRSSGNAQGVPLSRTFPPYGDV